MPIRQAHGKQKIIDVVLIVGFLIVDFLLFHDFFKAREQYTVAEYLVGLLSIPVLINSVRPLLNR